MLFLSLSHQKKKKKKRKIRKQLHVALKIDQCSTKQCYFFQWQFNPTMWLIGRYNHMVEFDWDT